MSKYTFKAEKSMDKLPQNRSAICGISEDPVLVYGKLKSLFGEPIYETQNLEEQYAYCICAVNEEGQECYIEVYNGSSGAAIGGSGSKESSQAAAELVEVIQAASAVDYDYTGYYMDAAVKICQGIKNGEVYQRGEELNLSEEEFAELYKRLYGLDM